MRLLDNIYSECFEPVELPIYDGVKKAVVKKYVPCGKCYHCRITKVNEWVTRMSLQSMISKHSYYVTLTYDSCSYGSSLFEATHPAWHNISKQGKYQYQPLTLCKKHLQDFFKRLRKNTDVKFQYYACGEYGSTYGRPHYHFILWSDEVITKQDMEFAWSTMHNDQRIKIGNVDFVDMNLEAINPQHPMKYVCKYVQKASFSITKLPTYKYHYENFNKKYNPLHKGDKLLQIRENWRKYEKAFSPFTLSSKRPAIGFQYFAENKARFQVQDFRIFELPKGCIFPTYYVRKTKESLCPFKTISLKNGKPNSYSIIPQVEALLVDLQNAIDFNEDFLQTSPIARYNCYENKFEFYTPRSRRQISVPRYFFSFYDCENHFHYRLAPDFMYNVCDSKLNTIYRITIDDFLKELRASYMKLYDAILLKFSLRSDLTAKNKEEQIKNKFESYEEFAKHRKNAIQNLLNCIEDKQRKYNKTKNQF